MAQWAQVLRQRFEGRPIAVGLELRKGPLIYALPPDAFLVLCAGNPTTLATYRQACCLSDATDDPTDAELTRELLMTHRDTLTALQPPSAAMRAWPRLVAHRRSRVADKVRLTHRLTAALKPSCPQLLEWFKDKDTMVFCDVLTRWPTLKQAQRARKARLTAFCQEHHGRSPHIVEPRIQAILRATTLTTDSGVIRPTQWLVAVLVQHLGGV
jgi:Transposase